MHGSNPGGILGRDRCDRGRPEDPEALERLEVSLDSRAASAVASGDRQRHREVM
jgi:hypothetical protein